MKPAHSPQATPEAPARVEFQVQFSGGPKSQRRAEAETDAATATEQPSSATTSRPEPVKGALLDRIPKITRLLVLGHHFESLVRGGQMKDYAEIARLTGLTRARVTQITNLTLLAPEIQEELLRLPSTLNDCDPLSERDVRVIMLEGEWTKQRGAWHR